MRKKETIPTYDEETMLAFIDILGFKELLKKELSDIVSIVTDIINKDNSEEYSEMLKINTKLISDSLIVFAQLKEQKHVTAYYIYLSTILARIHKLGRVVTRGYISTGNHYSNDKIWISPVFVEAYEGEKKAIHPRVILGNSTIKYVKKIYPEFLKTDFFRRDLDGYWFINYLTCISESYIPQGGTIIGSMSTKPNDQTPLMEHKNSIISGINKEKKYANKYFWLASYHNEFINKHISGPQKKELLIDLEPY